MKALKVIALTVVAAASLTVGASYAVGEGSNSLKALAMGEFKEVKKSSGVSINEYIDNGMIVEIITFKGNENEFFYYEVSSEEEFKFLSPSKGMRVTYHRDLSASVCGHFVKELGGGGESKKKCVKTH